MSPSRALPSRHSSHETTPPATARSLDTRRMRRRPQPRQLRTRVGPRRVRSHHRPRRARALPATAGRRLRLFPRGERVEGREGKAAPMTSIAPLFGIELPIIQAPMAGVQLGELAAAVTETGGLGSLPCALLTPETMAKEIGVIRARSAKPFNVNFFCHAQPAADAAREAAWRERLQPYYAEFGID